MKSMFATVTGALFALFILAITPLASLAASSEVVEAKTITSFDSLATVKGAFVGAMHPIRGVAGAGLPWTLGSVSGYLKTDGTLQIDVKGLVLADDTMVPAEKRGTNPLMNFIGILSCKTMDAMGMVMKVNTSTDMFPATMAGDAKIETMLHLPYPCVAPVVFVATPTGHWIAVSGH